MSLALDPNRWQRLNTLFEEALTIESYRRSTFLDEVCGSDAELRHELESLLSPRKTRMI